MELVPHGWHVWLLAGIAAAALELHFGNFVLLWFALGAVASAAASALGASIDAQLLLFVATSCALFGASRTIFQRLIAPRAPQVRHGEAALIGAEAVVAEALGATAGAVRVHGELWNARSLEGAIGPGERVQVERVEGLKLYVRRAQAPVWASLQTKDDER